MPLSNPLRASRSAAYAILLFPYLVFSSHNVEAACTTIGLSTVCDATLPNPVTSRIGNGDTAAEDHRTVSIQSGALLAVEDSNAISLRDNANVTVQSGGTVSANAVASPGLYNTGGNTVEFRNNGVLTVQQGGQVLSNGPQLQAEAVNVQGTGNTIVNNGLIRGTNAAAIWFQNITGANVVVNNETGVIQAPADVLGASGNGAVDFTNRGKVIGNLVFAGADDTLRLYTGSSISGNVDGGAGNNTVYLNGMGASTLPGTFTGFQTLVKQDAGTWTLSGTMTGVNQATVQAGMLLLTGNNAAYNGRIGVQGTGTLAVGDAQHASAVLATPSALNVTDAGTLGGYGSVTANVNNAGTVAAANAVQAFAGASNGAFAIHGNLTNAGVVAIGGTGVGNQLHVTGRYLGQNGVVALNSQLAGDNAASDRLVISGGTATGTSALQIRNVGGQGAATLVNGIQVIEANQGATTDLSAFRLAGPVKAGAYSYYLAKGGVTDGTSQNWYLRNTVPVAAGGPSALPLDPSLPVSAANPLAPANTPLAAAGSPQLSAAKAGNTAPTPLYRPEAPIYADIQGVARQIGVQQIDTFHDRQGDQSLLTESGSLPAAWGRVWGGHTVQSQGGALQPQFDGSIFGAQAGHDLYADSNANGHRNHYGVLVGFARATGDVQGFALGTPNRDVGHLSINAYSLGGYWTHIGPGGWYTDAVLMGTSMTIDPMSNDGLGASTHGRAVTGSLEAGLPIPLTAVVSIEPQAQIVWQNLAVNDLNDGASTVSFNHGNTVLGRLGVRMQGNFQAASATWQPYVRANVLRQFGSNDQTTFGGTTTLPASVGQTSGQVGAGVVAKLTKSSSAYMTVSYLTNLGGSHQRTVSGNAGMRWAW